MTAESTPRPYPRPLIFLHIPKAAGTTLEAIIIRQYRGWGYGWRFTGPGGGRLETFLAMGREQRAKIDVLAGHVHYGIHEHLPDPAVYVTMLRDPVERIVSHYYFVARTPEHYLHPLVAGRGYSLHDYVENRTCIELDNDQVRWLTRREHDEVPFGTVSAAMLDEAKSNLRTFRVVGLAERFDESLLMLRHAFGWQDVSYVPRNVGLDRPPLDAIPGATLDLIRERNPHDLALYEFAVSLFEARLAELGPGFPAELARFRAQNEAAALAAPGGGGDLPPEPARAGAELRT